MVRARLRDEMRGANRGHSRSYGEELLSTQTARRRDARRAGDLSSVALQVRLAAVERGKEGIFLRRIDDRGCRHSLGHRSEGAGDRGFIGTTEG